MTESVVGSRWREQPLTLAMPPIGRLYVAIGNSLCTMRAAQAVFQNVYLQFGFLTASDAPIETLVDVGKLAPFGKQLAAPTIADWSPDTRADDNRCRSVL